MPDGQTLEFSGVTKRFGAVTAVSDFSARVEPGKVTGFLGPNGAGKTTSLRILLGLVRATSGTATIGGQSYAQLKKPLQTVGAVLEASSFHPGRTAANHLTVYAQAAGLPATRVDEALATVGLAEVAGRKVGGFSLGMRQRLGLAYALLGDPGVLVLDEPANGLDPEGIKWMRGLLRQLARQGRTVLVSSHLLAEVQQTADALLIISQGRLVFQGGLDELADPSEYATVVDSADRAALVGALTDAGIDTEVLRTGLTVRGVDTATVGSVAAAAGVALTTLQRKGPGLEEVFLELVNGTRVHASATGAVVPAAVAAAGTAAAAEAAETPAETEEAPSEEHAAEGTAAEEAALAAGLDEATAGSPGAAAGVAAAGIATAAAVGDAEEHADAPDAAEPHPHAAFAVAGTGVVEVVPDDAADDGADGPEPDASDEVVSDAGEPVAEDAGEPVAEDAGAEDTAERVWAMPAAAPHDDDVAVATENEGVAETSGEQQAEDSAADSHVESTQVENAPADEESTEEQPGAEAAAADTEADGDDEPAEAVEDAPTVWARPVEETPEPAEGPEPEPDPAEPAVWTWPPDDEPSAPDTPLEPEAEPDAGPTQWHEQPEAEDETASATAPRTEADLEADQFFSSFDQQAGGPPEQSGQEPSEIGHDDNDGGEPR